MRRRYAVFPRPVRFLMVQQFSINASFYMLMPYLAAHLSGDLGLAAWAVGLVLGARNFFQQGMFLLGGSLADRLGYRRVMTAGCLLRAGGFALLGFATTLPTLVTACAATGFAGALFNPAVRAYLAAQVGEARRVEAFACFNVFYQAGMFAGPLIGLALLAFDFRVVCALAALVFVFLALLQVRLLPRRTVEPRAHIPGRAGAGGVHAEWRTILANRPFVLFSLAMTGSYILSYQLYLTLPLAAKRIAPGHIDALTAGLFALSALVATASQVRIAAWVKARIPPLRAIVAGVALLAAAFTLPIAAGTAPRSTAGAAALCAAAALIALAGAVIYPFEMDTVVALAHGRLLATHYGFYNTVTGLGITLGNLVIGAVWGRAERTGHPWLPWCTLAAIGLVCIAALAALERSGLLQAAPREREPLPA